jgi:hypothetical protein
VYIFHQTHTLGLTGSGKADRCSALPAAALLLLTRALAARAAECAGRPCVFEMISAVPEALQAAASRKGVAGPASSAAAAAAAVTRGASPTVTSGVRALRLPRSRVSLLPLR